MFLQVKLLWSTNLTKELVLCLFCYALTFAVKCGEPRLVPIVGSTRLTAKVTAKSTNKTYDGDSFMKYWFLSFTIFACLSVGQQSHAATDYSELDNRTDSCTRNAIASSVNSWTSPGGSLPSSQRPSSYAPIYELLQKCGLFPSSVKAGQAELGLIFGRSYDYKSGGHVSLTLPNGQRITYQVKKGGDGKYEVDQIRQEDDHKGPYLRLFGTGISDDEKKEIIGRLLNDCKMSNPMVLDTIDRNVKSWLSTKTIPDWNNGHKGYEKLFNDLKRQGVFGSDVEYKHFIFGRSYDFQTKQYGNPHLSVTVGNSQYSFKIDPDKQGIIRPPSCDNSKVVQLRTILSELDKQQKNGTQTPVNAAQ